MIVIWSQVAIKSHWVIDEAGEGVKRGILVPVMFFPIEPPLGFRSLHTSNLSSWKTSSVHPEYVQFLRTVQTLISKNKAKYLPTQENLSSGDGYWISKFRGLLLENKLRTAIISILVIISIISFCFALNLYKHVESTLPTIDSVTVTSTSTPTLSPTNTQPLIISSPTAHSTEIPLQPIVLDIQEREDANQNGKVIHKDIYFTDSDGDAYVVVYEIIQSGVANPDVDPDYIYSLSDEQKNGAVVTGTWECGGAKYKITLKARILDKANHSSESFIVEFDCR